MTELTRDQQLLEEFKDGLEKDGPVVLAQRVAQLEDANAALTAAQAGADEDVAAMRERAEAAERERDAAVERAEKAEAGEKKLKASVRKADAPARPRKLGAIDEDKRLSGRKLRAAIENADEVEIVFSDGKHEVLVAKHLPIDGDAWRDHQFGLMLREPVDLDGPEGAASVSIAGYVLLLDGKPVAWAERSTPLQLAPGQRVRIADDIIF